MNILHHLQIHLHTLSNGNSKCRLVYLLILSSRSLLGSLSPSK